MPFQQGHLCGKIQLIHPSDYVEKREREREKSRRIFNNLTVQITKEVTKGTRIVFKDAVLMKCWKNWFLIEFRTN